MRELSEIVSKKKAKSKKYQEAALLSKHNRTILTKAKRHRYGELYQKLEADTITEVERQEFLILTKEDEKLRNERVKLLIQLSHLKEVSFNQLLKDLRLKPVGDV